MSTVLQETDVVQIGVPTPFPIGAANVFLIHGDPPMLIDTGPCMDEGHEFIRDALKQEGLSVSDLGMLVVTHGHTDHIGLLGRFMEESGAETWGHPLVKRQGEVGGMVEEEKVDFLPDVMRELGAPQEHIDTMMEAWSAHRLPVEGFEIHHVLEDGDKVGPFTAYHVPGHSASDTLLVDHETGITITGDHLLKQVIPSPLLRHTYPEERRDRSLVEYQASLRKSRALELGLCFPGHGDPFDDGHDVIDRIVDSHERRSAVVLSILSEGTLTPYEMVERMYRSARLGVLHLRLAEAVGHLEVLEERGEALYEARDGVTHFSPVS